LAEHEDTLGRVVETLKEPVHIDPAVDHRVMAEIALLPSPAAHTTRLHWLRAWLRHSWTVQLNPLSGLVAAAALVGVMLLGGRLAGPRGESAPSLASQPTAGQLIQFVLVAPEAATVAVVGDFNDWSLSATPLARQAGDGVWWVTMPLAPGRYRYAFLVDGTNWRGDPNAPSADDEFGRPNSVVTIGG
jgi:hypothetical protein